MDSTFHAQVKRFWLGGELSRFTESFKRALGYNFSLQKSFKMHRPPLKQH